jgi:hypothetical protein
LPDKTDQTDETDKDCRAANESTMAEGIVFSVLSAIFFFEGAASSSQLGTAE